MESTIDTRSIRTSSRGQAIGRGVALRCSAPSPRAGVLVLLGVAMPVPQSISDLNSQITSAQSQAQSMAAGRQTRRPRRSRPRTSRPWRRPSARPSSPGVLAAGRAAQAASSRRGCEQTQAQPCQGPRAAAQGARRRCPERLVARSTRATRPTLTELLLSAKGFDDLANRAELVGRIENADASLAARVRKLRDEVAAELAQVQHAKAAAGRVQPAGRHRARPDRLGAGQRRGAGRAARAGAPARGGGCVRPPLAGLGLGAAGDSAAAGAGAGEPAGRRRSALSRPSRAGSATGRSRRRS